MIVIGMLEVITLLFFHVWYNNCGAVLCACMKSKKEDLKRVWCEAHSYEVRKRPIPATKKKVEEPQTYVISKTQAKQDTSPGPPEHQTEDVPFKNYDT